MNKKNLKKEADEYFKSICKDYNEELERTGKRHYWVGFDIKNGYIAGAEPREKRIAELEEKISVLLSCKNCPDNKGGLICQKEYEDKCLAQKIQYIKELQEEKAELEEKNIKLLGKLAFTENALNNAKAQIEKMKCCGNCENRYGQEKCADCHKYSKWKFRQAEQFYEEIAE